MTYYDEDGPRSAYVLDPETGFEYEEDEDEDDDEDEELVEEGDVEYYEETDGSSEAPPGRDLSVKVLAGAELLATLETDLFAKREQVEVLWLELGKLCARIVDEKLFVHGRDEQGNHFRTAQAYFKDLDRRFRERGLHVSVSTMNKFLGDYRLFVEGKSGVTLTPQQVVTVGRSNLEVLGQGVRRLQREGKPAEAVALVTEVVEAAVANGGLPTSLVREAVDDLAGRVSKGLSLEFENGMFGRKLKSLTLWWGGTALSVVSGGRAAMELTQEQEEWILARMGIKPKD